MFDAQRFLQTLFAARTAEVAVPDLRAWFGPDDAPVFIVRGLTGEEVARANEAADRAAKLRAALEALADAGAVRREAVATVLGTGDDVPDDLLKRYEHLIAGSVEPAIDREIALKLFREFPIVGYQLTNKILELTGMGADPGKSPGSGPIPESEPPSP